LMTAAALAWGSQHAQALTLVAPGTAVPVPLDQLPTSAVLATVTDTLTISPGVQGSVTTTVYAPDPGTYGALFSGLIFTYDITLNSIPPNTEPMKRLSTENEWAGFLVGAGQNGAGQLATTADNAPGGGVLGFNFPVAPDPFVGGESTAVLILGTDAQTFKTSLVFGIDGGIDSAASFAPAPLVVTTPDGGTTALLLSLGMFAMAGIRRQLS